MARFVSNIVADRPLVGIGLILLANLMFSGIDTSSKWLSVLGLGALQLSFMRYFGHFAISFGLFAVRDFSLRQLRCEKLTLVLLRSVLLAASTVFNFAALHYLPLTLTSTILFSAPIIICALSWPLLRERVGLVRWSAVALGFTGVAIAIKPFDTGFHIAVVMSLAGAFCFALYSILTRKLAGIVDTDRLQFYAGLVGAVLLLPFAVLEWQNPQTGFQWAVLFAMGFFGWAGHQLLTVAMRFAPASLLMPFGYALIVYMTLWSFLIFHQAPDVWNIIGAAIVILSGLIIYYRERMLFRRRAQSPETLSPSG